MFNMISDDIHKDILEADFRAANPKNLGDYKISFNAEHKTYFIFTYIA